MPFSPLFECTYPGCRKKQRGSRCSEHRWSGDYASYQRTRREMMLAHLRKHGLRCPGAENHAPHPVARRSDLTVDHIVPRSRGGTDERRNLRIVCGRFNYQRGNGVKDMLDYRSEIRLGQTREVEHARERTEEPPPKRMKIVRVPADVLDKPTKKQPDGREG